MDKRKEKLPKTILNLNEAIWSKVPKPTIDSCEKGKTLTPADRTTICNFAVQYLRDILKDSSRKKCGEIAQELCKKYPKSSCDSGGC